MVGLWDRGLVRDQLVSITFFSYERRKERKKGSPISNGYPFGKESVGTKMIKNAWEVVLPRCMVVVKSQGNRNQKKKKRGGDMRKRFARNNSTLLTSRLSVNLLASNFGVKCLQLKLPKRRRWGKEGWIPCAPPKLS